MRWMSLVSLIVGLSSCGGGAHSFECDGDAACNLAAGGTCVTASTGHRWCAYPDEDCPSGLGFSNEDAGDNLAGTCVPGNRYKLTVTLEGQSMGTVSSMPAGMSCSAGTCTALFAEGTVVDLSAQAVTDQFLNWSGACSGRGACSVTMTKDQDVQALFGKPGQVLWAKQFGSNDADGEFAQGVAIDSHGDLIAVGQFENTITVKADTTLTANGSADIFVMKISSATGAVVWAKQFGGPGFDSAYDVALDSQDNIYVVGGIQNNVNFGGQILQCQADDGFALKLATDGGFNWVRKIGGNESQSAYSVAVNGNNVVVSGGFDPSITIGTTTLTTAGQSDFYITTLSGTDGTPVWAKSFGGTLPDDVLDIDVDATGSIVATGRFAGTVNFGGGPLTSAGANDIFLLKVAGSSGAHQVSSRFGGAGSDIGDGVAVDKLNNIVISGEFNGTVDFGCATPVVASHADRNDMFVAKFSAAGSCAWAKGFGGTGGTGAYGPAPYAGLVTNSANEIAVGGQFCGTLSFGGDVLSAAGSCPSTDIFAARFDSNGNHLTSIRGGGTGEDYAYGLAQSSDGRSFVVGGFSGFSEFGTTTFMASGSQDILVLALAPL